MTIAEKVKSGIPITRDEFRSLVAKTDWGDYSRRVTVRMAEVADRHELARARSWAAASRHVLD